MNERAGYTKITYVSEPERKRLFAFSHFFSEWNSGDRPRTKNCYAFAADAFEPDVLSLPRAKPLQIYIPGPGTSGGLLFYSAVHADSLRKGLIADGFIPTDRADWKNIAIPQDHYLIACFHSLRDFHFYRYHEKEKIWYHKPSGYDPVTPFDFSGRCIMDVLVSDRGNMIAPVGFFLSPPDRPPLDIIVEDEAGHVIWRANAPQINQRRQPESLSLR